MSQGNFLVTLASQTIGFNMAKLILDFLLNDFWCFLFNIQFVFYLL